MIAEKNLKRRKGLVRYLRKRSRTKPGGTYVKTATIVINFGAETEFFHPKQGCLQ